MRKLLNMMKNDKNALSLARVCSLVSFFLFAAVTVFLVLTGKPWAEYKTLATVSVGYCCVALLNKGIDAWGLRVEQEKKEGEKNG